MTEYRDSEVPGGGRSTLLGNARRVEEPDVEVGSVVRMFRHAEPVVARLLRLTDPVSCSPSRATEMMESLGAKETHVRPKGER